MERKNPIRFGTDGWRAVIAEDFTFENVRYCARGVAEYLKKAGLGGRGLVIGYDTRFASEDFAAAAAGVVAGQDIKVYLAPAAAPTPVVSYGVVAKKAGGAIIITASHNPARWNGFKFKDEYGASASDEVTSQITGYVSAAYEAGDSRRFSLNEAKDRGLIEDSGFDMPYFAQVARLVDLQALRNAGLKIVVDPMYGAGSGYLRRLLEGGSTRVIEIHAERNPLFPGLHPEPIMPHLSGLAQAVKENRADIGLAHDGDADRMGVVDEKGNFLNQLQVFALLCLYLLEVRGERGAIVKTITTTNMAYRLGELFNVPVYETAVGFKYVAPVMAEKDAIIGGEESGGYGFRGHIPERDGILASLCFLDLVVRTGKTPSELLRYLYEKVGPHHYRRIDIKFPEEARRDIIARVGRPRGEIDGVAVDRLDTTDGFRFILRDGSWLLVRFSGTEPLLRIYTETDSPERVERLLAWGREMAGV